MNALEHWLLEKPKKRWVIGIGVDVLKQFNVSIWEEGNVAVTGSGPTIPEAMSAAVEEFERTHT